MSEAARFLDRHTAEIEPLHLDYNHKYWVSSLTGTPQDAAASAAAKEALFRVYARPDEYNRVRELAGGPVSDPLEARQLVLLRNEYAARQMDPAVLADLVRREEEIEVAFNSFRATLDGGRATENEIRRRLREERDPAARQAAWEASKQIGAAVRDRLVELVRLRNREARRLGHRDFFAMALELQELDETDLFQILGRLKAQSEGPFTAMKAELDRALAARYNLTRFTPWPWMYADPFFQEAPPGSAEIDLDAIFEHADIEDLTRRTFDGIGLPVGHLFGKSDFHEREGKCQHAFCTHLDRKGDVRVLTNIKPDEYWMTTMLHEFGHAAYDGYLDFSMPFVLRQPTHILLTEAIAMLMGRLTRSADWLSRVAGLPPEQAESLASEIRRALRVQMLVFVRWGLLLVHFEREMYRDPDCDLNSLWWSLAADFQKITPPPGRNLPDWASKIHLSGAPVYYQNYLLGEMSASQIETALGAALSGNGTPRSFVGEPSAGRFLKERIFRLGARHHWQETLRLATGRTLDPGCFLSQFVNAS